MWATWTSNWMEPSWGTPVMTTATLTVRASWTGSGEWTWPVVVVLVGVAAPVGVVGPV